MAVGGIHGAGGGVGSTIGIGEGDGIAPVVDAGSGIPTGIGNVPDRSGLGIGVGIGTGLGSAGPGGMLNIGLIAFLRLAC